MPHTVIIVAEEIALRAIHLRDKYTHHHCLRVWDLSMKLFEFYAMHHNLKDWHKHSFLLSSASRIHDVGKIAWSDPTLKGKKSLTKLGLTEKMEHPEAGASAIFRVLVHLNKGGDKPFGDKLVWIIILLYHHWNYDDSQCANSCYPRELKHESLQAYVDKYRQSLCPKETEGLDSNFLRVLIGVVRLSDSIDAATYPRPHKPVTMEWHTFVQEIENKRGFEYHPDTVDVFLQYREKLYTFMKQSRLRYP